MDEQLIQELIQDTTIEDISETYRPVVDIIGIKHFAELGQYARGDDLYFPKLENILMPARNRRIEREYDGYNARELADKYNLTVKQICYILRNVTLPGQINLFELLEQGE